ncbi:Flp pilus assembly protein CpaB [Defluviimonas sp. WL0002]|uniref:Flp pilus assembly protein CpaB n=1 Tax=Albidovulum marisflavi TaxID=2984159 RepID=A0ABT2ZA88_9RHOB|nr:Flp pilus assembly protein CpaB [Defluviimonas sp. WL0002]MCV2868043.1 Flp pilus assembly protein CpaB [Defluviimonas sp. WL0002]
MRLVFGLVLIVGLGLAGFAVYMAQGLIEKNQRERDYLLAAQARATKLVDVVVVKRHLDYGERFTRDDLQVIKWEDGKVPEGAFSFVTTSLEEAAEKKPVFTDTETRPRSALRSYEPFEPLLASKITDPGVDAGIMSNLSPGMSAFSINVDVSTGVAGFLRPGNFVDVYWTGNLGDSETTKLIDSNVRLIAINQSADADRTEETIIARTVTIEGTRQRVASLALAQQTGKLSLSLVGGSGVEAVAADDGVEINRDTLLGIKKQEVVEVEKEKICTIRTNKGGEIVETVIPCTN